MASERRDGPRRTAIATCSFRQWGAESQEAFVRDTLSLIDEMARQAEARGWRLDLAVLPECSFQFANSDVRNVAEEVDGPFVRAVAAKAKEHGCYATAPIQLRREGKVYNSVVLLDRRGERVGIYDKVFPVMMQDGSLEYGITPGRGFPVFELDFGRVGVQICWDIAFDDGWKALAEQEVELVIYPTNPASPLQLRGRACRGGYYIVAGVTDPPAMIVDPLGRVLGTTAADREVLVRQVDLDYRVLHSNCLWDWPESRRKEYEGRVALEWDEESHEYLVTSSDPALPVRRFLEAEGLVTGRQRIGRNIELQLAARGGAPAGPERPRVESRK